jgi:ubiquinone/menaquinone biosynthesis C-methylase UbiE
VDGMNYPNVQVVCDLAKTPFMEASLDGILSVAVLEHVANPEAHVAEMYRVLKPGGSVLCFVPFMQGYHASPNDFQRYTESGLRQLFGNF